MNFGRRATAAAGPSPDAVILLLILGLSLFGLLMVYSSSAYWGEKMAGDQYHFFVRQAVFMLLGFGVMYVGYRIDYHRYRGRVLLGILAAAFGLLLASLFASQTLGSRRWLPLGPLTFQPGELAKFAVIAYLAHITTKNRERVRESLWIFLGHLIVPLLFVVIFILQPDYGSAMIVLAIAIMVSFAGGTRFKYIAGMFGIGLMGVLAIALTRPERVHRLETFVKSMLLVSPENLGQVFSEHESQVMQVLVGFASGGISGMGIGGGKHKFFYISEGYNDFILATIGQETGFIGFLLLLTAFVALILRGTRVALKADSYFGSLLAFGIVALLTIQILINTGVTLGLLPAKGLTLPLISYGGTSLLVTFFMLGVLLNISRSYQRRPNLPLER